MKKGFSGIKDLDLIILSDLDDKDLLNACLVDKHVYEIYNTDSFWRNRLVKKFGEKYLEYIPEKINWRQYYIQIIIDLDQIRTAMIKQIRADFVGREENLEEPFNEDEIEDFIKFYRKNLEKAVIEMYEAYRNDNELNDLRHAELDWYREFLYEHIPLY